MTWDGRQRRNDTKRDWGQVGSQGTGAGAGKDTGGGGEAKLGIPVTEKSFAELGLSLLHLQQNVCRCQGRIWFCSSCYSMGC